MPEWAKPRTEHDRRAYRPSMVDQTTREYAAILREADEVSSAARSELLDMSGHPPSAGMVDRLANKARELGARLQEILPELGASSGTVEVSFPPALTVSVTWQAP